MKLEAGVKINKLLEAVMDGIDQKYIQVCLSCVVLRDKYSMAYVEHRRKAFLRKI